jgi:hypothetical protein
MTGVALCADDTGTPDLQHFSGHRHFGIGPGHDDDGAVQGPAFPDGLFDAGIDDGGQARGLKVKGGAHAVGDLQHALGEVFLDGIDGKNRRGGAGEQIR